LIIKDFKDIKQELNQNNYYENSNSYGSFEMKLVAKISDVKLENECLIYDSNQIKNEHSALLNN